MYHFRLTINFVVFAMFCCNLSATEKQSYIWLEEPNSTDFNTHVRWEPLSHKSALANIPVGKNKPKEKAFAEFVFNLPQPAGKMTLWGRTFDPHWSSPLRWRIDEDPWQKWTPGPIADRVVFNKNFPIEWHKWGKVNLKPGKHILRIETLGKRKYGDYPYFILDVLVLAKGSFSPKGAYSPKTLAEQQVAFIKQLVADLPEKDELINESKNIMKEMLENDLGKMRKFDKLITKIKMSLEARALVKNSLQQKLHGKINKLELDQDKKININIKWNAAWNGKLWIGFSQNRALYASTIKTVSTKRDQLINLKLPSNLPQGRLMVHCVPIDQIVSACPQGYFDIPDNLATTNPRPSSWGIYRDNAGRLYPWQVNANNMMYWGGKPYIPFGGMINSPLTWGTSAGGNKPSEQNQEKLRNLLLELRKNGIRDIYFNGCFVKSNPEGLARIIAISEECGMRYGIHPSSSPSSTDIGFVAANKEIIIPESNSEGKVFLMSDEYHFIPNAHCIWYAFADNKMISYGIGTLKKLMGEEYDKATQALSKKQCRNIRKGTIICEMKIQLPQPAGKGGVTVKCIREMRLDTNDLNGYLGSIDDLLAKYREVYGGLKFGSGLRLWIDPLENEMHHNPVSVCTSPKWQQKWRIWLQLKYGTIAKLRKYWGNANRPILPDFKIVSQLVPMVETKTTTFWFDPVGKVRYACAAGRKQSLRDLKEFSGQLAEEIISRASNTLKDIANVPVVLKHNCWFSDWFVNPRKAGGLDGMGYESYCYGDSLPFHNSLTPYAEVLQSAKNQWAIVTESSPAAFEGQKNYCGYLDRLQMIYDIDQLMMLGAKGFYYFGFSFDGNPRFDTTDMMRDVRQLEWLSTQAKTYEAAVEKFSSYRPEVYGWYPAYLREKEIVGKTPETYEMDGHYTAVTTQIRQAADGRWIIPALKPEAAWYGLLVAEPLTNQFQRENLLEDSSQLKFPVYLLGDSKNQKAFTEFPANWKRSPLNGFTSQGIGVVPTKKKAMTLKRFQQEILGYRVFQTYGINGRTMPDGSLLVWTCVEHKEAELALPKQAKVTDINGKPKTISAKNGRISITLTRPPYEKQTKDFPSYIMGGKYFYPNLGQPEVAIIHGISVDQLLAINRNVRERWLPAAVKPEQLKYWQEAENFSTTTFNQPRLEGFSRYSNGCAIGINTQFAPPEGETFKTSYSITTPAIEKPKFWLRRMQQMSQFFSIAVKIDGKQIGQFGKLSDIMHLNPWSAGLSRNNLNVGWTNADCQSLAAGKHTVEIIVVKTKNLSGRNDNIDVKLLGGKAEKKLGKAKGSELLSYLQLDAWILTENK